MDQWTSGDFAWTDWVGAAQGWAVPLGGALNLPILSATLAQVVSDAEASGDWGIRDGPPSCHSCGMRNVGMLDDHPSVVYRTGHEFAEADTREGHGSRREGSSGSRS